MQFKEMATSKQIKLGTCVAEFSTPGIGYICKAAGCDFVFFDMEHEGFTFETLKSVLRYMEAAQVPTLVRPPSHHYHHIALALDMGAEALLFPHVSTGEQARAIVHSMHYPPEGRRGAAFQIAHDRYMPGPFAQKVAEANERVAFFATVEDAEGIENVDDIAATPGLDGIWIGHTDLSTSLGISGQYDHPDFITAVDRVATACRKYGRSYGRLVVSIEEGERLFATGADMICYSGDIWLLHEALARPIDALRSTCTGEAGDA